MSCRPKHRAIATRMKYLSPPRVKNFRVLRELAGTDQGPGNALLRASLRPIFKQYARVRALRCDATKVPLLAPAIPADLKGDLEAYFKSKRDCLRYIRFIRRELSPEVCPLCGSKSSSSVDHMLGRAMFPELMLLSLNLVPACSCNSVRRVHHTQSALHPYFDKLLEKRIVTAIFRGPYDAPTIAVVPTHNLTTDMRARVAAHVESVLIPNNVVNFLTKRWRYTVEAPLKSLSLVVGATSVQVLSALRRRRDDAENDTQTPNNWESILYHGMQGDARVVRRLVRQLSGIPIHDIAPL